MSRILTPLWGHESYSLRNVMQTLNLSHEEYYTDYQECFQKAYGRDKDIQTMELSMKRTRGETKTWSG